MSVSRARAALAFFALVTAFVVGPALIGRSPASELTAERTDVSTTSTSSPERETGVGLPTPGSATSSGGASTDDLALPGAGIDDPDQASEVARSESSSKQAAPAPQAPAPRAPQEIDTAGWKSFGEMNIADFSATDAIIAGDGQPGSARFACFASHFNYDDPIVAPGQPGAAHLHLFLGNTLANSASTFESLSRTGDSTCSGSQLNRSAYWVPALIDTKNQARIPQYSLIYYKAGPMTGQKISTIPDGLVMIAGNARSKTAAENDGSHTWYCGFPGNYPVHYNESRTIPDCKPGDAITLALVFPQCWDGVNLDSANHRDHLAYPEGSTCPASHPVIFPQITYNIFWNNSDMNTAGWYLSSDKFGGVDVPGGTTTHGDWFGAWHPDIMKTFVNECNNQAYDCKGATISQNLRLLTSPNTGVSDGQDIFNGSRSPQFISVNAI